MERIFIPTSKGMRAVEAKSIIRVEANSNYCKVYFDNGHPLTVAKVLQWFEANLPGHSFYRIHRGHIVNRNFIASVSGGTNVLLQNGEQLQVSKRKKSAFKKIAS